MGERNTDPLGGPEPSSEQTPAGSARLPAAFHRLWASALVSAIGDGLRFTALPLLAAQLSGQVIVVAAVTAASTLPWLLFGLFAGVAVDRLDRRTLMWTTDLVRAGLAAGFVALLLVGAAHPILLIAFAFLLGSAQTIFDTASGAFVPAIVPRDLLAAANGRLVAAQLLAAQLVGPAVGGFLFAVSAKLPFAIDAVSFLAASLLVWSIVSARPARARTEGASIIADVVEGLRWLNGNVTLRAQTIIFIALSAASGAVLAVFVLYVKNILGLGSQGYGLLLGGFAVGGLLGSMLASVLRTRTNDAVALISAVFATVACLVVLGLVPTVATTAVALVLFGAAVAVWTVVTNTIRQELVPDALLGRIMSIYRLLGFGAAPIGALVAGASADVVGIPAMFVGGAAVVVIVAMLFSRGLRALPASVAVGDLGAARDA